MLADAFTKFGGSLSRENMRNLLRMGQMALSAKHAIASMSSTAGTKQKKVEWRDGGTIKEAYTGDTGPLALRTDFDSIAATNAWNARFANRKRQIRYARYRTSMGATELVEVSQCYGSQRRQWD